eukprot:gnl/TRDRNA2_/TRDRNA2_84247_c0_seq1.p1 gnl/TRDRNA2_/TRDRNA2_84247_c0~~gnl/TRDRNA2_/TRDRNA2_84247_c0_seq1.p1  ORF type:complete len:786 (-),score=117.42 gnl/TRDRNA2_/TRDRNA2_84247_c0_seq1:417-2774(-)
MCEAFALLDGAAATDSQYPSTLLPDFDGGAGSGRSTPSSILHLHSRDSLKDVVSDTCKAAPSPSSKNKEDEASALAEAAAAVAELKETRRKLQLQQDKAQHGLPLVDSEVGSLFKDSTAPSWPAPTDDLLRYWRDVMADESSADVHLVTMGPEGDVDQGVVLGHRIVLHRIPFFRGLLAGMPPGIGTRGPVELVIRGVTQDALRRVLIYVYTDSAAEATAGLKRDALESLLAASIVCDLPSLRKACEEQLLGHIASVQSGTKTGSLKNAKGNDSGRPVRHAAARPLTPSEKKDKVAVADKAEKSSQLEKSPLSEKSPISALASPGPRRILRSNQMSDLANENERLRDEIVSLQRKCRIARARDREEELDGPQARATSLERATAENIQQLGSELQAQMSEIERLRQLLRRREAQAAAANRQQPLCRGVAGTSSMTASSIYTEISRQVRKLRSDLEKTLKDELVQNFAVAQRHNRFDRSWSPRRPSNRSQSPRSRHGVRSVSRGPRRVSMLVDAPCLTPRSVSPVPVAMHGPPPRAGFSSGKPIIMAPASGPLFSPNTVQLQPWPHVAAHTNLSVPMVSGTITPIGPMTPVGALTPATPVIGTPGPPPLHAAPSVAQVCEAPSQGGAGDSGDGSVHTARTLSGPRGPSGDQGPSPSAPPMGPPSNGCAPPGAMSPPLRVRQIFAGAPPPAISVSYGLEKSSSSRNVSPSPAVGESAAATWAFPQGARRVLRAASPKVMCRGPSAHFSAAASSTFVYAPPTAPASHAAAPPPAGTPQQGPPRMIRWPA